MKCVVRFMIWPGTLIALALAIAAVNAALVLAAGSENVLEVRP